MAVNLDAILRVNATANTAGLAGLEGKLLSIQNVGKGVGTSLMGIGSALTGVLGIAGAGALMGKIFGDTGTLEKQNKSLEVLLGSAEKAKVIIGELKAYGAVTPFEATDLIETAKKLTAFGVTGDEVVKVTKRLGDVAGATGANLNELATVYGQVVAKGRLQTEELLQFQERGVGIQEELQRMYGMSGEQLAAAITKGKISAEAVEVAINRLTSAGGKYANGAIAQSDTLFGKMSTLQDTMTAISQEIGQSLEPMVKGAIEGLTKFGEKIGNVLQANREPIKQAIETIGRIGQAIGPWVVGLGLVVGAYKLLTGAIQAAAMAQAILQGFSGPKGWAMLAAGVGATAVAVGLVNKAFEDVESKANGAAAAATGLANAANTVPPPLREASTEADAAKQKIEEAKAAQEAFKLAVDQSNFSYDLLKATIQATFQEVELMNELSAAEYDANISINNSAISILRTKMQLTDNEQEKLALTEEIMKLEIANANFQKKATQAQIIQEINVADLKRRQLWTDLRRVDAALALAKAEGRVTQEMKQALELAKQAANSADREFVFTQKAAEQKERAADAAYDAAVFNARAGLEIARQEAASRERTRQQRQQKQQRQSQYQPEVYRPQVYTPFATGGYVTAPTKAIIGEGGQPEYVIPADRMAAASTAYLQGARGVGVVNGQAPSGGGRSITVNTGPIMQQPDGSRWASLDDLERGIASAVDQAVGIVASPAGRMATWGA